MKKAFKITLLVLCIFISVSLNNVMAEETITDDDICSREEFRDMIKQKRKEALGLEPIIEFDEEYEQSVIDEINNNNDHIIIGGQDSAEGAYTSEITNNDALDVQLKDKFEEKINSTSQINSATYSTTSSSSTVPELYVEPVANPYNVYNSVNESVSYTTGALNFEQSILSIPGRNGLDLDISIKYNTDEAVITKNEYDKDISAKNINFNNFAIGWSFNFTTIIKERSGINASYGYNTKTKIRFADGSSYEISGDSDTSTEDKTLTISSSAVDVSSFIRKGDTKEYVLTYDDGTIEYFDGIYGNILKRVDRFGNQITFEYEDVDYFRGSFVDYIGSPDVYVAKLHLLKKITTSNGEIINIEYTIDKIPTGNAISEIKFLHNSIVYATITLKKEVSFNGEVDILKSYTDAEGYTISFEYDEYISHSYYRNINYPDNPGYNVIGSVYALVKTIFPSGDISQYEYAKKRRTYNYYDYYNGRERTIYDWYEIFKVSMIKNASGKRIYYEYEGDISGYPHTLSDDNFEQGIATGYYVNVIDKYNELGELYTFDTTEKLLSVQKYDRYGYSGYVPNDGNADHTVSMNGELYSVGFNEDCVFVYKSGDISNSDLNILNVFPISSGFRILGVKTHSNTIYIFCQDDDFEFILIYDNSSKSLTKNDTSLFDDTNIYYYNGMFFTYKKATSSTQITFTVYNPSEPSDYQWTTANYNLSGTNGLNASLICVNNGYAYLKIGIKVVEYDLNFNSLFSKNIDGLPVNGSCNGFALNGKIYINLENGIYELDFENGTLTDFYQHPEGFERSNIYKTPNKVFAFYKPDRNSPWEVYSFEPDTETVWNLQTYRMFNNNNSFKVICGNSSMFMSLGYQSDYIQGYESLGYTDWSQNLISKEEYEYNGSKQIISVKKTAFKSGNEKKIIKESSATYVNGTSALQSTTDELGNVTTYEYTDSTYYIPTKITLYANTNNALVTENTLSDDKKKIISTVTKYADRDIKKTYTYDSDRKGNVVREITTVQKDSVETVLSDFVYSYSNNSAYVSGVVQKNIVTNDSDFEVSDLFDISVSVQYDKLGRVIKHNDTLGRTTNYTYNKNGNLLSVINSDNSVIEYGYDIVNKMHQLTTTYNDGYATVNYYSDSGQVLFEKEKSSSVSEQLIKEYYYANGLLEECRDYLGYNYYIYDNNYNIASNDRIGNDWKYECFNSRLEDEYTQTAENTVGTKTSTEFYDAAGRKTREEVQTDAGLSITTYEYDYMGNLEKTTDANGDSIIYQHNDMGQLLSVTDELGRVTSYEYDLWGNVVKVIRNGTIIEQNEYDNIGRLLKTTDAANSFECYAYDNAGNLVAFKDKKGQVTTYTYDNMNRILSEQIGDLSITYTYDLNGNVLTMTDSSGTTTYEYYYDNNLKKIITPDNKAIIYEYDTLDNVIGITDYAGNEYEYLYDGAGRLDTITFNDDVVANYDYDASGVITKVTYPEGYTEYTYDNAFRLLSITNKKTDSSVISGYAYTYDLVGNQIEKDDTQDGGDWYTVTYTYDDAGRLTAEEGLYTGNTFYVYDNNDNMIRKEYSASVDLAPVVSYNGQPCLESIKTSNYTYNNLNQLVSETQTGKLYDWYSWELVAQPSIGRTYTYDANGNMTSIQSTGDVTGTQTYTYNYRNQLVEYTDSANNTTTYTYDGTGMRVSKTKGNDTTRYYWDRGYVSNERNGANFTATNHIGTQGIFARTMGTTTHYLFKNGHGDVENIYPQETGATSSYTYDAYGNIYRYSPTYNDNIPITYTGEYLDEESGLIYLRNRYYNPSIGRFITEDPIKDGFNWYAYCSGNPVAFVDPLGLEPGEFFETYYDALEDWTSIYFPQSEYGKIEIGSALYLIEGYGVAYTEPIFGTPHETSPELMDQKIPYAYYVHMGYIHAHPNSDHFSESDMGFAYDKAKQIRHFIYLASRDDSGTVNIKKYYVENDIGKVEYVSKNVALKDIDYKTVMLLEVIAHSKWKLHLSKCQKCPAYNISPVWPNTKWVGKSYSVWEEQA